MVFVGTTPIGNLLVSSVAGTAGVPAAFVVSGLPCFAAACLAGWLWHRQDERRAAEHTSVGSHKTDATPPGMEVAD
jgi:hypothetical protein